ncbi:MAG: carbon storage regulator [Planctomycetales bacterium]|nr:carbon storage regulator [Planctomycetales bacterium]
MLVLSRKKNEKLQLGDSIQVTVIKVSGDKVRLGIEAPSDTLVLRKELAKLQEQISIEITEQSEDSDTLRESA